MSKQLSALFYQGFGVVQSTEADAQNAKAGLTIGAEWQHAVKQRPHSSALFGASVPSTHVRLADGSHAALIARWAVNSAQSGVEGQVCPHDSSLVLRARIVRSLERTCPVQLKACRNAQRALQASTCPGH